MRAIIRLLVCSWFGHVLGQYAPNHLISKQGFCKHCGELYEVKDEDYAY